MTPTQRVTLAAGLAAAVALVGPMAGSASADLVYGLTTRNQLVSFDSASPGTLLDAHFITGMQGGEEIIGIDFRPATGQLYAMGSFSRLYTLNTASAAATAVGTGFTPQLNGVEYGFDFNPVADRIRVTSDLGQNFRLDPVTGGNTAIDGNLAYGAGDPNFGVAPRVTGSAYTNNFVGGLTTQLFNIDSGLDILTIQSPPNNGTLATVGGLGFNTSGLVGFDIYGQGNIALASLTAPGGSTSGLFSINLATGAATAIGTIGVGTEPILIRDITVIPGPAGLGVLCIGGLALVRRRR